MPARLRDVVAAFNGQMQQHQTAGHLAAQMHPSAVQSAWVQLQQSNAPGAHLQGDVVIDI